MYCLANMFKFTQFLNISDLYFGIKNKLQNLENTPDVVYQAQRDQEFSEIMKHEKRKTEMIRGRAWHMLMKL